MKELSKHEWYRDISITNGMITIERRPVYCNRGRFIVKVFSNSHKLHIDEADMFPRYYFHWDCLVKEIEAWMKVTDQALL